MIKRILFLFMLVFSHLSSSAGITDGKFGVNQIFDVQYWWNGTTLNASSFIAPYDMNWSHPTLTTGQYFAFFPSTTNPGSYGLGVYNANGTRASIVHNFGDITALGNGAIFYIGSGFFGNVITTSQGYSYGASAQFTNMDTSVTASDLTNYTFASTTPLAAGQTATVSAPVVTVTGTSTTYTTRTVVSGNTTTNYRTPVTTTTYSDGTTTSANGTEATYSTVVVSYTTRTATSGNTTTTYQTPVTTTTITGSSPTAVNGTETVYSTAVTSNVVTNKIVNGVLTVYTTPIITTTLASDGSKTVTSNGAVTTTTQNVSVGLTYQVWRYDSKTYSCGWLGCVWDLGRRSPSTNISSYGNPVRSGTTTSGMFLTTNGRLPNGDTSLLGYNDNTVIRYVGTITAPVTANHPAGTVYRLYFYNNTDDGFKLSINNQLVINQDSTNTWQSIGGYTGNGYIDVVAGQAYNIEAWYWNVLGGVGHKFYWDFGAGISQVPNAAFTTGWITESNIIDVTGTAYSNTSIVNVSGTYVDTSLVPSYVTIGSGTPGDVTFGSAALPDMDQQTRIDTWTAKTVTDGNKIYIDQVGGTDNTVTMIQDGSKNLINMTLNGTNNTITARQGVQGIGQNEMKLNFEGNNNVVNVNQARDTQGNASGTNGHYLDATIAGWGTNLTVQQTNSGGVGGHYNETTIYGNGNNVTARQTDNGNKIMFLKVDGALNTIDAVQKGTGQHKLDVTLTGNSNNVQAVQEGTTANSATLNLTNAGGPASVILQQNGGQSVSVTTSCATAGGCAPITVRQGY